MVIPTWSVHWDKRKKKKTRRNILKSYDWSPTKKDIKRGFAIRTFVRQGMVEKEVYEVSELDAEKSGILYEKIQVDWTVGYNKELVFDSNEKNLEILEEAGYIELLDELDELDGYLGDEDVIMTKLLDMVPKKPKLNLTHKISVVKRKLKRVERRKRRKRKKVVWVHLVELKVVQVVVRVVVVPKKALLKCIWDFIPLIKVIKYEYFSWIKQFKNNWTWNIYLHSGK